jgi:hypothetical protein
MPISNQGSPNWRPKRREGPFPSDFCQSAGCVLQPYVSATSCYRGWASDSHASGVGTHGLWMGDGETQGKDGAWMMKDESP